MKQDYWSSWTAWLTDPRVALAFGIVLARDIIDKHGAEVAFPASTIHLAPAEPEVV